MIFLLMKKMSKKIQKSIKLIIFDLDDTLYDEFTFVESGFHAVARYLAKTYVLSRRVLFLAMKKYFKYYGRGKVFDKILEKNNIKPTKKLIMKLVSIYRTHIPSIKAYPGVKSLLRLLRHKGYFLVLITDTNWRVQARKVKSLGMRPYFDFVLYTNGRGWGKPDLKIYKYLFRKFNVKGTQVVCIGDDPRCDFIGAKKLGCFTIRIKQGRLKNITLDTSHEADKEVLSIKELFDVLATFIKFDTV